MPPSATSGASSRSRTSSAPTRSGSPATRDGELIGIERNIAYGVLDAVTLTTLEYATGRSITWAQADHVRSGCKPHRCTLTSRLTIEHVMASSALPLFFPAIELGGSWHGDGGVRLVAPFAPAIELGASRILAISTRHQQTLPAALTDAPGYPPPAQVLGQLLDSVFLDVFDQDPARVARINGLVAQLPPESHELALHLDDCAECRRAFDAARVEIDAALFESLAVEGRQTLVGALAAARTAQRRRRVSLAVAAALAALSVAAALYVGSSGTDDAAVALVEDHIRYLDHPDRWSSEDPAAVVAELSGHVDFPVRLPDLSPGRLTGGRRCYLLGRRVALAFYATPAGPVSYFVLGAEDLGRTGSPCASGQGLACSLINGHRACVDFTDGRARSTMSMWSFPRRTAHPRWRTSTCTRWRVRW